VTLKGVNFILTQPSLASKHIAHWNPVLIHQPLTSCKSRSLNTTDRKPRHWARPWGICMHVHYIILSSQDGMHINITFPKLCRIFNWNFEAAVPTNCWMFSLVSQPPHYSRLHCTSLTKGYVVAQTACLVSSDLWSPNIIPTSLFSSTFCSLFSA
jgi:hypothetical protein